MGLKEEIKQCKLQLIEQKQNQTSLIAAAKIEGTSGNAADLLAQYKAGVKDGAQIASGKVWSLNSSTPGSFSGSPM